MEWSKSKSPVQSIIDLLERAKLHEQTHDRITEGPIPNWFKNRDHGFGELVNW